MSGAFQGFVINRNLEENPIDRNALNNLGESPIADDIALFKNNKRNTSVLVVANSNINSISDVISFNNTEFVYTNKTKVIFGSNTYYVKNSNGKDSFQLSTNPDLSTTVELSNNFAGTYARSDEITFDNIANLSKIRRAAITSVVESVETSFQPFSTDVIENLNAFEFNLDNYNGIRENAVLRNQNYIFNTNLSKNGYTLIEDPDGVNNLSLSANSGPGLFVYNFISNTNIRAFSDSQNVWKPNEDLTPNTYLETTAKKITTGQLTLNVANVVIQQKAEGTSTLVINASTLSNITTSGSNPVFTHKAKVIINNEEYFLCLSNTSTVP